MQSQAASCTSWSKKRHTEGWRVKRGFRAGQGTLSRASVIFGLGLDHRGGGFLKWGNHADLDANNWRGYVFPLSGVSVTAVKPLYFWGTLIWAETFWFQEPVVTCIFHITVFTRFSECTHSFYTFTTDCEGGSWELLAWATPTKRLFNDWRSALLRGTEQ